MPDGTTCTAKLDGDAKYIVGSDVNAGEALEVNNTIVSQEPVETTITINKVIMGTSKPLTGARFKLTKVIDTHGNQPAEESDRWSCELDVTDKSTGSVTFTEITPGMYQLEATIVPEGYVKKEGPYFINVDENGNSSIETSIEHELISPDLEKGNTYTVQNEPGAALPSTGGMGTALFYILGSALTVSAGTLIVVQRRRKKAKA